MIVAAAFLLAGAGSLALIARELRKAPEGYEDDHGFHAVHQEFTGGQVIPMQIANISRSTP